MRRRRLILPVVVVAAITIASFLYLTYHPSSVRAARVINWIRAPHLADARIIHEGSRCGDAPFIFPTTGIAGFLWGDSFRFGHRHQGVDIFAGKGIDTTPVVAAYPGLLTRLPEWKSSVIVRIPNDPLQLGRQIWVYYTHMADSYGNSFISDAFPPGTYEEPVQAGEFLGKQGDYSGDPNNPVGVHLHVSIVRDEGGRFMNELEIENTLDPSPYFGLALNSSDSPDDAPVCATPSPD
jgi:peptidoglycan LD-endopeptidase LytH